MSGPVPHLGRTQRNGDRKRLSSRGVMRKHALIGHEQRWQVLWCIWREQLRVAGRQPAVGAETTTEARLLSEPFEA